MEFKFFFHCHHCGKKISGETDDPAKVIKDHLESHKPKKSKTEDLLLDWCKRMAWSPETEEEEG